MTRSSPSPGGLGTLEELFEVYTWSQLGLHRKPCALLNVEGYYDGVGAFLDHAVSERFVRYEHRSLLLMEADEWRSCWSAWRAFEPESVPPKWIDREPDLRLS